MSRLLALVDAYKDTHGQPSDASIARAVGIAPQTLSSWRKRGIRELPDPEALGRLAGFLGFPRAEIVIAASVDAGYMTPEEANAVLGRAPEGEVGGHDRPAAM